MKVTEMPRHARPREKLFETGPSSLKTYELLAILLRSGYRGKSALDIAQRILHRYSVEALLALSPKQLAQIKGVGKSRAASILAAHELVVRSQSNSSDLSVTKPSDIVKAAGYLQTRKKEYLVALYLSARKRIIDTKTVSVGTVNTSLIHPREVFAPGLILGAVSVALAHNHPSGDPSPSVDDIAVTKQIAESGKILGVELVDHIIVGNGTFISMKEQGIL